jgi:hypothetical protein
VGTDLHLVQRFRIYRVFNSTRPYAFIAWGSGTGIRKTVFLLLLLLTYLKPKLFLLFICYNGTFLIIKLLIVFKMNVGMFLSRPIMVGVTALIELFSK